MPVKAYWTKIKTETETSFFNGSLNPNRVWILYGFFINLSFPKKKNYKLQKT